MDRSTRPLALVTGASSGIGAALARVFETAEKAAEKSRDAFVTVERLLLALAIEKGRVVRVDRDKAV